MKNLKFSNRFYLLIAFSCIIISCQNSDSTKQAEVKKDTIVVDSAAIKKHALDSLKDASRIYFDISRHLAGLKQEERTSLKNLDSLQSWITYAHNIEKSWNKLDSNRLLKMKVFSSEELKEANTNATELFYPFSGPDFLNAFAFFPSSKKLTLIGLEPVGTVPDSIEIRSPEYFKSLNKSLYAILNFSFFRTLSMAVDLKAEDLDGALPLIMVFIARTDNRIIDIKHVEVDTIGNILPVSIVDSVKKVKGVEVKFITNGTDEIKTLYYFSADISDQGIRKHPEIKKMFDQLNSNITYLKSASYLMHKDYFSIVRETILSKSKYVLQDDSGIPLKYFDRSTWDLTFYGNYNSPIPMFSRWYQQELKDAYDKTKNPGVKPLAFGIGYSHKANQSNLMLAKKKS